MTDPYHLEPGFRVFLDEEPARILRDDGDTLVAVAERDNRAVARIRKPVKRSTFQIPLPWTGWWVGGGEFTTRRDDSDRIIVLASRAGRFNALCVSCQYFALPGEGESAASDNER